MQTGDVLTSWLGIVMKSHEEKSVEEPLGVLCQSQLSNPGTGTQRPTNLSRYPGRQTVVQPEIRGRRSECLGLRAVVCLLPTCTF